MPQNIPQPEDLVFESDIRLELIDRAVAGLPEGPEKALQRARIRGAYKQNSDRTKLLEALQKISPEAYLKVIDELTRKDLLP